MDKVQDRVEVVGSLSGVESIGEICLVEALRRGDEAAFVWLLDQYHTSMVRVAMVYARNREVAEEIVQETWVCVLQGLDRFKGHASLKTWIFHILTNRAKTRGQRENRSIPFSALSSPHSGPDEPAVNADRFIKSGPWEGHWSSFPLNWEQTPEDCFLSEETRLYINTVVETLPPNQQLVITLRDIEGWSAEEICNALGITETNQRVMLHRARSRVRAALEQYMGEEKG